MCALTQTIDVCHNFNGKLTALSAADQVQTCPKVSMKEIYSSRVVQALNQANVHCYNEQNRIN